MSLRMLTTNLDFPRCQPREGIDGTAVSPQFDIEAWPNISGRTHHADGLPRGNPLPDACIDSSQAGKQGMISLAVGDDQELPIIAKFPCKRYLAIKWRDNLS